MLKESRIQPDFCQITEITGSGFSLLYVALSVPGDAILLLGHDLGLPS